jgi:hypothetical protein
MSACSEGSSPYAMRIKERGTVSGLKFGNSMFKPDTESRLQSRLNGISLERQLIPSFVRIQMVNRNDIYLWTLSLTSNSATPNFGISPESRLSTKTIRRDKCEHSCSSLLLHSVR